MPPQAPAYSLVMTMTNIRINDAINIDDNNTTTTNNNNENATTTTTTTTTTAATK